MPEEALVPASGHATHAELQQSYSRLCKEMHGDGLWWDGEICDTQCIVCRIA